MSLGHIRRLIGALAFSCLMVSGAATAGDGTRIALTFDDLPAHGPLPPGETRVGVTARLAAALSEAGVDPGAVYGFINGAALESEPEAATALDVWRAAGLRLGNHTWSHVSLHDVGLDAFAAEAIRNEPVIATRMEGDDWRWFRFPYLAEGADSETRDAARAFLARRGYRLASVTMDFSDWAFNEPYVRCATEGDTAAIAWLEDAYLEAADAALARSRAMAAMVGRDDMPFVLLLHGGAFHAHMLPRLLAFYRAEGVTFASLAEVQADPFYLDDMTLAPNPDRVSLEAAVARSGQAIPPPLPFPAQLETLCRG